jgi:hypothetical protein
MQSNIIRRDGHNERICYSLAGTPACIHIPWASGGTTLRKIAVLQLQAHGIPDWVFLKFEHPFRCHQSKSGKTGAIV